MLCEVQTLRMTRSGPILNAIFRSGDSSPKSSKKTPGLSAFFFRARLWLESAAKERVSDLPVPPVSRIPGPPSHQDILSILGCLLGRCMWRGFPVP